MAEAKRKKQPKVTAEQARADIAAARARLSGDVREVVDEVHPRRIVQRQVEDAKSAARVELEAAKSQIKDADGWRWDRIALIGGAVGGLVAFVLVIRRLTRKR
ncbi:DUF3618 domain-containing protein [Auraticoccus cholistanensis]|nr:DUF3618 domain-containing protein [Auraticoccus cholistanensis]